MATMTNILRALEGHILSRRCVGDMLSPHLLLLEPGMALSSQYTYLGTPEVLMELQCTEPVTIILAAPKGCGELPEDRGFLRLQRDRTCRAVLCAAYSRLAG